MESIIFKKIPAGTFLMGASTDEGHPLDKERPQVSISIKEFEISEMTITNSQFKEFIDATGYKTIAEKLGGSFVFHCLLDKEIINISKKFFCITLVDLCWRCFLEKSLRSK